jgi:hypothetical protein
MQTQAARAQIAWQFDLFRPQVSGRHVLTVDIGQSARRAPCAPDGGAWTGSTDHGVQKPWLTRHPVPVPTARPAVHAAIGHLPQEHSGIGRRMKRSTT